MQDKAATIEHTSDRDHRFLRRTFRPWTVLWLVILLLSSGIFVYSRLMAFVWDEGFHLVAAQLIAWGKTPYIDFTFPQTLLNAYINAAVLRFVGQDWRTVHVFDSLFVAAALALTGTYVMRRFPDPRWRLACAVLAACSVGLDTVVLPFGPVAQAYGIGMLWVVGAFRVAVLVPDKAGSWMAFWTGVLAGAAAGSTLLTAPALPVLFFWILYANRGGSRRWKLLAFCCGGILPFAPEIWLFIKAPQQTLFNMIGYQALFRRVNWGDVNAHDFDVFTDWTISAPDVLLGLFALIGILFLIRRSNWSVALRREYYLAAWLAAGFGIYISTAHPTFGRYFIFMVPFLAILGSAGFYYAASRVVHETRPLISLAVVLFVLAASAAKYVFDDRDGTNWHDYEKIAAKVKEVTPPGGEIMADELVYFILRQAPPPALEFSYSHKLELPPKEEALYHIISFKKLKQQVAKGRFQTFETCKDDITDDFKLTEYFPNHEDFDDCTVFWRKKKASK